MRRRTPRRWTASCDQRLLELLLVPLVVARFVRRVDRDRRATRRRRAARR